MERFIDLVRALVLAGFGFAVGIFGLSTLAYVPSADEAVGSAVTGTIAVGVALLFFRAAVSAGRTAMRSEHQRED